MKDLMIAPASEKSTTEHKRKAQPVGWFHLLFEKKEECTIYCAKH
jgi:hypothetical protein